MTQTERDFSTISPSAKSLLVLKSQTAIPYAARAAALLLGEAGLAEAVAEMTRAPHSTLRVEHFEDRYTSLDELLAETSLTRVLEVGAGLSFRGLDMARRPGVFYLDTDLPEMSRVKADLVAKLCPPSLDGTLRVRPLDALDAEDFRAAVSELPDGPIAVVNEGLLVYLDENEKARLARHIREALLVRGGAWITADVYVRREGGPRARLDPRAEKFLSEHRVEENKFAGWEQAERFFADQGFAIVGRHAPVDDTYRARQSWVLEAKRP